MSLQAAIPEGDSEEEPLKPTGRQAISHHRGPTQSVCVADCYFIVNVLDSPFASPIAIDR